MKIGLRALLLASALSPLMIAGQARANCTYTTTPDDGCVNALAPVPSPPPPIYASTPQLPTLLATYGTHRPHWNVAGVEYAVGVPATVRLVDPSVTPPTGCTFGGNTLSCNGDGITVKGYDFSLHGGLQLNIIGSGMVTQNKFAQAPNCKDPLLRVALTAGKTLDVNRNSFDGGGPACTSLLFGAMISGTYGDKSVMSLTYNYFTNIPTDTSQNRGPNSGAAQIIMMYNLFYRQGFSGHPDGIQYNGGNFDGSVLKFNTYYNPAGNPVAGTQPFHIEAQLTASISNSIVAYNTVMAPGTCNGGRDWPKGCSINIAIACKNDQGNGWVDSNTGFKAYGNYVDWSGAIRSLLNGGCPGSVWGTPAKNVDLKTGAALSP
jgi:hypothetical protein